MKMRDALLSVAALGLILGPPALAQESKKPAAPTAAPAGMPPLPKPGPEHDALKAQVGTWDATVEAWMAPGAPPMTSQGVETNTLLSGLWLITDFKGEVAGLPFLGHGITGFDELKKKYLETWVDSMALGPSLGEATYDAGTKTMTGWLEGPDMTGQVTKMKSVTVQKDADTRVFTLTAVGPDGKEVPGVRITYKRRK